MRRRTKTKTFVPDDVRVQRIATRLRKERAYHEAAHAVAALAHGLAVKSISLPPADNHAGGTMVSRAIYLADDNPDAQIAALRVDIIVTLAGPAAQMKLRPWKRNYQGTEDDLQLARALATWAAFIASGMSGANVAEFGADGLTELTEEERAFADRLLNECEESAHKIVADHWADIATLAKALLDCAVLNAEDIDALLRARDRAGMASRH
jgi:ATP-dependent Zn protease